MKANRLTFVVPGRAVPKERPGFGKRRAYTPARTREFEAMVRAAAIDAKRAQGRDDWDVLEGPVAVEMVFYLGKKNPRTEVTVWCVPMSEGRRGRGDIDNLCKSVLDGMQSEHVIAPAVLENDGQVVRLKARIVEKEEQ